MTKEPAELGPDEVYRACDLSTFSFKTSAELPELKEVIGQPRAVSSVEFGMGIENGGYNIFAAGPTGTGKSTTIYDFLSRHAASCPAPDDWVYVHNFLKPYQPNAIRLPAGKGQEFRKDMEKLVEDLQAAINQAFESEEYEKQKRTIAQQVSEQQEGKFNTLSQEAEAKNFMMLRTPSGLAFAPKGPTGEAMSREEYEALSPEDRKDIDDTIEGLNENLQQIMRLVRQDERGGREALRELDREVTTYAAKHLIDEAIDKWSDVAETVDYLQAVLQDVVENADDFKKSDEEAPVMFMGVPISSRHKNEGAFRKYRINVLVDNTGLTGAPVITESNPVMQNLVGRVEHQAQFGTLITDFNMIKPGALHKANGGFLVLEARDLLLKPYSWDALKRTLKTKEIRVEDIAQQLGFSTTSTLDPEPIPFKAKIVLTGEPFIYYLLYSQDPDFEELFKVKADFDNVVERTPENEQLYARFVGEVCRTHDLPPFSPDGVARVIEHCSRLVGDQRKMTARFLDVTDLITQSAYWARDANKSRCHPVVRAKHVQKAIDHRIFRCNRIEQRLRDLITDHTIMVDTKGAVVGQINGLSVSSTGDYTFGRPNRITATHRLGDGEVIDIEREVDMGGPIHSKGVMILAGFLGQRYSPDRPLSLSARLVFEQSYSGVEGDSASSAELYAILSSLSNVAIQQRFAVTGSVNQLGQIQAIGGVNEKIEGFFEVCQALGAKGDEGVLIPRANVHHLMLNEKVRHAMAKGNFHIYPVSTIDEGIAILTGRPAGRPDKDGLYPADTINRLVVDRLAALNEKAREATRKKESAPATKESGQTPE
ncbi:MAG: Lon protease family protein [Thermoleophilia bacterium]|jgi:lon-related putative ATP-dependent protease